MKPSSALNAHRLEVRELVAHHKSANPRVFGSAATLARTAASFAPDITVVNELPAMWRGRAVGEVPALLEAGLHRAGMACTHEPDEYAGALDLLAWAQPGDVVVLPVHTAAVREKLAVFLER